VVLEFPPVRGNFSHLFFAELLFFIIQSYNKIKNSHTPSFLSSTFVNILLFSPLQWEMAGKILALDI
jgi:hypothetical protein